MGSDEPASDPAAGGGAPPSWPPSPPEAPPPPPPSAPEAAEIQVFPKRGEDDAGGAHVDDVLWATKRFVIYQAEGQIRYLLPDDYETARGLRRRIADLGGLRASIEDLRAEKSISDAEKKRAAREVAWALADAFEDDAEPPSEKPKEVLTRVDARLRSLVKSVYRRKFVIANLIAFGMIEAILILIAVVLHLSVSDAFKPLAPYALYGAMGALGAFLSVMIGIRTIDVNLDLKGWEHIFSGATRIFIGVIGAWVVGLALDSGMIDPTFGSNRPETEVSAAREDEEAPAETPGDQAPAGEESTSPAPPEQSLAGAAPPNPPATEQAATGQEYAGVVPVTEVSAGQDASASAAPPHGYAGKLNQYLAMYLMFTFLAGFSESLVPNLLRRGEQAAGGEERSDSADQPIVEKIQP